VSNHLITATYKANLRTPMRKAVMVLLADKASDDGSGIWASKQTMADELCCSKQAVIDTVKAFVAEGLLREDGQRKSPNGYTNCYAINVEQLVKVGLVNCHAKKIDRSLSNTSQSAGPVNEVDVTSQSAGPKPSRTHVDKPKGLPTARARKISKEVGWSCIPKSWSPPAIEALPQQARACAEKWTAASYAAHGEAFHSFWRSSGKKLADWDTRWAERVITMHSQIMRDQKYGTAPMDTAPKTITKPMTAAELHRAIDFNRTTGNARRADELAAELARLTGPPNEVHAF